MGRRARILVCIFLLFPAGAALLSANNIDLIVLLDTSESVFPIFDDLVEFIVEDTLENHLQFGDFFHLVSFADSPQIEVSEQINSSDDIENVIKHLFLLQPLGSYTDLLRALQYLYQFTTDLPEARKKYIVILTDGIHDPPPDSPFLYGTRNIDEELKKITDQINAKDWDFRIIQLPQDQTPQDKPESISGPENIIEDLSRNLESGIVEYPEEFSAESSNELLGNPSIEAPPDLGDISDSTVIPIRVQNHDSVQKEVRLNGLYLDGVNILVNRPEAVIPPGESTVLQAEVKLPEGITEGQHNLQLIPEFANDLRFSPNEINAAINVTPSKWRLPKLAAWKYILIVSVAVLFAVFIFFLIRRLRLSVDSLFKRGNEYAYAKLHSGIPIELIVVGQNSQIGMRNVHTIADGSRFCVGGDGSPFVIFLHPFPRCIAEIHGKDDKISFYKKKDKYFPEYTEDVIPACLNTRIYAVSDNGKKVEFYFRKYISPLERINKIMRLTSAPGPKDTEL